jgi:TctA family transporter
MMSAGDPSILYSRPLAAVMLFLTLLILIGPLFRRFSAWRLRMSEQEG